MERSYPVEYVDYENYPQEFAVGKDSEMFGTFQEVSEDQEYETKGRRGPVGVLKIEAVDKRPKCQPIGAQIDCRQSLDNKEFD